MSAFYAVVLAAGAGSRFGGSKLTAPWNGGVLLDGALAAAQAAPVAGVFVVTGAHADLVEKTVARSAGHRPSVSTIRCPDHASGMAASLRCGLAALPANAEGAFIFLGDMPHVAVALPDILLAAVRSGAIAASPVRRDRLGHPVLISRALFRAFFDGAGDGAGGAILRSLGASLVRIMVDDDGVLTDIDTPAELDAACRTP